MATRKTDKHGDFRLNDCMPSQRLLCSKSDLERSVHGFRTR